jgi:hypothetical protein
VVLSHSLFDFLNRERNFKIFLSKTPRCDTQAAQKLKIHTMKDNLMKFIKMIHFQVAEISTLKKLVLDNPKVDKYKNAH